MHLVPFLAVALLAADPGPVAKKVTLHDAEFDSLAEPLRILRRSGTVELTADRAGGRIEIELYKDGKKLPRRVEGGDLDVAATSGDKARVRFAVHALDLDYLPLGDGQKGHCRLVIKLGIAAAALTSTADVPKSEVDFSRMTSGSAFGPQASTGDSVPLFWLIGNTDHVTTKTTPAEVIRSNPKGDLAIVYLRLPR